MLHAISISLFVTIGVPLTGSPNGFSNSTNEPQTSANRVLVLSQNAAESGLTINAIYGEFLGRAISVAQQADRMGIDREAIPLYFEASRVDDIKASLMEARSMLRTLQIEKAKNETDRAAELFQRLQSPQNHIELHSEILSFQIELALLQSNSEQAIQEARLWARINPGRTELHPGLYSPTMVQNYQKAVEKNRSGKTGLMVLRPRTSNPTGPIEIFIDHQPLSSVDNRFILGIGPHLVSIRQGERLTQNRLIEIKQNELLVLDSLLPEQNADEKRARQLALLRKLWLAERSQATPVEQSSTASFFAQIAKLTGTDLLLWIDGPVIYVWNANRSLRRVNQYDNGTGRFETFASQIVSDTLSSIAQEDPLTNPTRGRAGEKETASLSNGTPPIAAGGRTQTLQSEADSRMGSILVPTSVGAAALIAGGFALLGGVAAVWFYWPSPSEPASPPRSVVVVCCGRGASQ
jgi:hypothetical protein